MGRGLEMKYVDYGFGKLIIENTCDITAVFLIAMRCRSRTCNDHRSRENTGRRAGFSYPTLRWSTRASVRHVAAAIASRLRLSG